MDEKNNNGPATRADLNATEELLVSHLSAAEERLAERRCTGMPSASGPRS